MCSANGIQLCCSSWQGRSESTGSGCLSCARRLNKRSKFELGFKLPTAGPSSIDRQLVIGAAIFGVGWGLSGFCPGPSLANLGALRLEALVFVPTMAIGMMLAQQFFEADR